MSLTISKAGIELIKEFEGVKNKMYKCVAGLATIGVGHVILASEQHLLTATLTEKEIDELLKKDLKIFENGIKKYVKVSLSQSQFDALVSFTFNVGLGNFKNSTLLKKLNEKDFQGAAEQFLRWNKVQGKVVAGLTRRREKEKELFEKKEE